ncbi:ATP-dependent nuclease [Pseudovibrio denitrificans]|uniref:ATP-dependent nuclease n=1 Tax=Pseudovibrio denitrificans TaxID=258256 RepID=UPI0039BFEB96
MQLDTLIIKNFQCFGPEGITLDMADPVTTLIGPNGAGKTAVFQALNRMFGLGGTARKVEKSDFHLPVDADDLTNECELQIEAVFSFPELEDDEAGPAVAEFWTQMSASGPDDPLLARIVLKSAWIDDGTPDGVVETSLRWVTRTDEKYEWDSCKPLTAAQRSAIQVIYVPANRGSISQVKALLRGRLWRAARWSQTLQDTAEDHAEDLQNAFQKEHPIAFISERLSQRWQQVNEAGTHSQPILKLTEDRFEAIIRHADVKFSPDPSGADRPLERLSDGQKSLFQIALTAALLEIEQDALDLSDDKSPFEPSLLKHVPLTLLLIEEPENSLSPFFLSRIMDLCEDIADMETAQVMLSSHSASILSRIKPETLRYCRLEAKTGQSSIRALTLPPEAEEVGKYVRQAVRAYPELYFAKLVVLGEGDSEQIVLPKLAAARGLHLDKAFCPIVPLGGRHVEHFWRLLKELSIPHVTLLDLDYGRQHGGATAICSIVEKLLAFGINFDDCKHVKSGKIDPDDIEELSDDDIDIEYNGKVDKTLGTYWLETLRECDVFFSEPIDIDFSMLLKFHVAYAKPAPGGSGPRKSEVAALNQKKSTLKKTGHPEYYNDRWNDTFRWYPYLFLSKSKPVAHLTAMNRLKNRDLKSPPEGLDALLDRIKQYLD